MWIVVEGIDGAGKTTVCRELEKHGFTYSHFGPPSTLGAFSDLVERFLRLRSIRNVVFDRGHVGNWVYQEGADRLTVAQMRVVEAFLADHNTEVCWLRHDVVGCAERSGEPLEGLMRDEVQFGNAAGYLTIPLQEFWDQDRLKNHCLNMQTWDTGHSDDEGIGGTRPMVWLLGEQRNPRVKLQFPFSTAAGMSLIWRHVIPEHTRVSNALRPNDNLQDARAGHFTAETLQSLQDRWASLGHPRVVCLGRVATEACHHAGVPVRRSANHPQFVWRFEQDGAQEWATELHSSLVQVSLS